MSSNIAMQIERLTAGSVNTGDNVLFDSIVYYQGDITYDSASGVLTFHTSGRYIINWSIFVQSTMSTTGMSFTLMTSQGKAYKSNIRSQQGQITGNAIVSADTVPTSVFLQNSTDRTCYYAINTSVTGNMVVFQDNTPPDIRCFAVMQMTHFLKQMVAAYPTTTWTVFTEALPTFEGTPVDVYGAPGMDEPGILRLVDTAGGYEAFLVQNITAVYPGGGTFYDPSFTFLPEPNPLPQDCNTFALKALQSYLPVGTQNVNVRLGPNISASGAIYKNELGLMILSDDLGSTPILLASSLIQRMYTETNPVVTVNSLKRKASPLPVIRIE